MSGRNDQKRYWKNEDKISSCISKMDGVAKMISIKFCVDRTWGADEDERWVASKLRRLVLSVKVAVQDSKGCKTAAVYEK